MQAILPKRKVLRYCLADIAKGLFNGMIGNYLLYFFQPTLKSRIPRLLPENRLFGFITIMALLTALGKIIDAISDPLVATLSDRCTSPKGRRIPFMRRAALPYAISVVMIFYAPFPNGAWANALWVGFFLLGYYVAYTFYFIPRNALIPEIISDAKARVGYYGLSTAFFMGSSSFMYAATLFVDLLKKQGLTPLWAWRTVFTFFGVLGGLCLLLSAFAFDEKKYTSDTIKPTGSIFESFAVVFKNKNFVTFSLVDLFSGISMAFFQASMLYYITILLNVPEAKSFLVMLTAIITALCLFPLVVGLSRKYGKKKMLIIANIIFSIVYCFIYFGDKVVALVPGYELYVGLAMGIVVAFPFAAINILPQSAVSDIIQQDSLINHINREGIFSSVKTFIEKIASAMAMMCVSSILALGAATNESVGLQGVKMTGLVAVFFSMVALIFLVRYDEKSVLNTIEEGKDEQ